MKRPLCMLLPRHNHCIMKPSAQFSSLIQPNGKEERKIGSAALTSLNSWIWACSNMENTLELAPSAVLFLAFLGGFWPKNKVEEVKQRLQAMC